MNTPLPYTLNLALSQIQEACPWDESLGLVPNECCKNKKARSDWANNAGTNHVFYSTFVGLNPSLRVSAENPPHQMRGIVADFDESHTLEQIQTAVDRTRGAKPTIIEQSPTPGRFRAIWLFDKPIAVPQDFKLVGEFANKFLEGPTLQAKRFAAGLDASAANNPGVLYCRGNDWWDGGPLLNHDVVQGFLKEFLNGLKHIPLDRGDKSASVPLDQVHALLLKKYPRIAEWESFELNSCGPAFFCEAAKSPKSTYVRPEGVISYSDHARAEFGGRFFYSWEFLLGANALEEFRLARVNEFSRDIYYDGKTYTYRESETSIWKTGDRDLIRNEIRRRGANPVKRKDEIQSELDSSMATVHNAQRVHGAAPFVGWPAGLITFQGERYLNTHVRRVMEGLPGPHSGNWGDGFPEIAQLIEIQLGCPITIRPNCSPTPDQLRALLTFLVWLHRFMYGEKTIDGEPRPVPGQGLLLLGPGGMGKTFLMQHIVGEIVGGSAPVGQIMSGVDNFGSEAHGKPTWIVDDASVSADFVMQKTFTERTKAFIADNTARYHAKHQSAFKVDATGLRLAMILNNDPASLANAPLFHQNYIDKLHVFETLPENCKYEFPESRQQFMETIKRELPAFVQFVRCLPLEDPMFKEVRADRRFGTVCYHDRNVMMKILNNGFYGPLVTVLTRFRDALFNGLIAEEDIVLTTNPETGVRSLETTDVRIVELLRRDDLSLGSPEALKGGGANACTKLRHACNQIAAVLPDVLTVRNDTDDYGVYKITFYEKQKAK